MADRVYAVAGVATAGPIEVMVGENLQFLPQQEVAFGDPPPNSMVVLAEKSAADVLTFYTPRANIGQAAELPVFNIRNGDLSQAMPLMVRASIPEAYYWTPIADLPPAEGVRFVDVFIRCASAQMLGRMEATVEAATMRKLAICLGVARATTMSYYEPGPADFIATECAPAMMRYVAGVPPGAPAMVQVLPEVEAARKALLIAPMALSPIELDVVAVLMKTSIAGAVLQGWSLVNTEHHYLTDNTSASRKAFLAVENQFWRAATIKEWMSTCIKEVQDTLWHKANHPLSISFKKDLAQNVAVKEMLLKASLGSIAARLPATEAEMRAAAAYLALFATVDAAWKTIGGSLAHQQYQDVVDAVSFFSPGFVLANKPGYIPAAIDNRAKALAALSAVTLKNGPLAAHALGFYDALTEREEMNSGETRADTIKGAYSIRKLRDTFKANYLMGRSDFSDYNAAKVARRGRNEYVPPVMAVEMPQV